MSSVLSPQAVVVAVAVRLVDTSVEEFYLFRFS